MEYDNQSLEDFAKSGLLPMACTLTGSTNEPIAEVIICDSISGQANYDNNMPVQVCLTRRLADGTEYRAVYLQVPHIPVAETGLKG